MLTRSLQDLEIHGMIWRKQLSNIPPHVVYGLTDQGKNIIPVLEVLEAWGETQVNFEKRND
jgi:DNA-binding HxlR family transcriptional regulator